VHVVDSNILRPHWRPVSTLVAIQNNLTFVDRFSLCFDYRTSWWMLKIGWSTILEAHNIFYAKHFRFISSNVDNQLLDILNARTRVISYLNSVCLNRSCKHKRTSEIETLRFLNSISSSNECLKFDSIRYLDWMIFHYENLVKHNMPLSLFVKHIMNHLPRDCVVM
jgi:hypothetical protein